MLNVFKRFCWWRETKKDADNGSELDVRQILNLENIKHVHGRPYHPQSQGMVENFNRYIKKYLILEYLTCRKEEFPPKYKLLRLFMVAIPGSIVLLKKHLEKSFFQRIKVL